MEKVEIEALIGKTFVTVENIWNEEGIMFTTANGEQYKMCHLQDCCETVTIDTIYGDLSDLVGTPIIMAEEVYNAELEEELSKEKHYIDSSTWTFYKLATIKGYVDVRWFGESNGYYSEAVDLFKI